MDIPTDTKPARSPDKVILNPNIPGATAKYLASPEMQKELVDRVIQKPWMLAKIENLKLKEKINEQVNKIRKP